MKQIRSRSRLRSRSAIARLQPVWPLSTNYRIRNGFGRHTMTQPRTILWFAMFAAALLLSAAPGRAQSFSFTTINVPCSACPAGIARITAIAGINPGAGIVGVYMDAVGKSNGFLLSGGQFTTIDVPGSLVGSTGALPTVARGISPSGDILGQFTAPYNPPLSTSVGFDSP